MMGIYRKKPEHVRAWRWEGKSLNDVREFGQKTGIKDLGIRIKPGGAFLSISVNSAELLVQKGDYLVQGECGGLCAVPCSIFAADYEQVRGDDDGT